MTIISRQDLTEAEATPMDDERIETRWFTAREVSEISAAARFKTQKQWWDS